VDGPWSKLRGEEVPPLGRTEWCLIVALTAIGAYLRLRGLSGWYLTGDDALHIQNAVDFDYWTRAGWAAAAARDSHPPLYYALLGQWISLVGADSLALLRLPGLVVGTAIIPLYVSVGRNIFGPAAGWSLGLLVCVGNEFVLQSGALRHYPLVLLLEGLLLALVVVRRMTTRRLSLTFLVSLALVTTHYPAALFVFAVALVILFRALSLYRTRKLRVIAVWGGACALLALAWGGLLTCYWQESRSGHTYLNDYALASATDVVAYLRGLVTVPLFGPFRTVDWCVSALLLAGIVGLGKHHKHLLVLAMVPTALTVALGAIGLLPVSHERWVLFLLPGAFLPLGFVLSQIAGGHRPRPRAFLCALVAMVLMRHVASPVSSLKGQGLREESHHWVYKREALRRVLTWGEGQSATLLMGAATAQLDLAEATVRPSWAILRKPAADFAPRFPTTLTCRGQWSLASVSACLREIRVSPEINTLFVLVNVHAGAVPPAPCLVVIAKIQSGNTAGLLLDLAAMDAAMSTCAPNRQPAPGQKDIRKRPVLH